MIKEFLIKQGMDEDSSSDLSKNIRKYFSIFILFVSILYLLSGVFTKKEDITISSLPTEEIEETFVAREDIEDVEEDLTPDSEEPNPGFLAKDDLISQEVKDIEPSNMNNAGFVETTKVDTDNFRKLEKQELSIAHPSLSDTKNEKEVSSDDLNEKNKNDEKSKTPEEKNPSEKIQTTPSSFKGFSSFTPYSPN